jgi:hypothetical protein
LLHIFALLARGQYAENQVIPIAYRAAFLVLPAREMFDVKAKMQSS